MKRISFLLLSGCLLLLSCDMQKKVDLKLPPYESQMVVECYLAPGKPLRLTILESVSYLANPFPPTVDSAFVTVTHNGIIDTLRFNPQYDPTDQRLYNYIAKSNVPEDYSNTFYLYVKDKKGRVATAETNILPPVLIDSTYFKYSSVDSNAAAITIFFDNKETKDYYRYVILKNNKKTALDYQVDDINIQSSKVELSSDYKLERNSEVNIALYHITKEFYDFYKSTQDAREANGNPFGQPSSILSNIKGGIGIFTGLSGDSISTIVP